MSYLYVTENNAKIGVSENYAYAEYKDGMIVKVPIETLESIAVFGHAQISTVTAHMSCHQTDFFICQETAHVCVI